jgi:hypothetical protein
LHVAQLSHCHQLELMGLTEVPFELFRMKNLRRLDLYNNNLCSLPSEIAHLATLERLYVRLLKGLDRDLTKKPRCFRSGTTSSRLFRPSSVC